ncbi:PDZ and LIM domain protein Zasp isoform X2 [Ixodes scapularis]|uniref:PDZ and LIM domain protein Zasp isoform X2 n=1 Tax=Ixodes scapularis TaxID=6945 RepID=UPI001C395A13|nr:PDZ and LIM domain protein Zasp isoform X2 [Ixodes scapularis]
MVDSVITVKLQRGEGTPWGFRLSGGKDFGFPLSVQRVNPGSLAEKGGLQVGDALLRIQGKSTDELRHKDAQDAIVRAGNYLELSVQRGASMTWKPKVTPVGAAPRPGPISNGEPAPVTKTSLAANKQPYKPIGTGHNTAAKPFGGTMAAVVHNQYNSPAPIYSMNNIADTLSKQTEVLTSGAVGINFMKGDKPLNKESAVYRMVLEEDKHPKDFGGASSPVPVGQVPAAVGSQSPAACQSPTPSPFVNLRHVEAPKTAPAPPPSSNTTVGGPNTCADCGRLIVGVFVRIKDRSLHAECFRCATCGTSLKNVGYFNVKDKLYCDIHAKQAARHIAPGSNLEPVPVPPGGHLPQNVPLAPLAPLAPLTSTSPAAPMSGVGQTPPPPLFSASPKFTSSTAPFTPSQAAPMHSPVPASGPGQAPVAAAQQPPPPPDSPGICYDSPVALGRSDYRPAAPYMPASAPKPTTPQGRKTPPAYGGLIPLHPVTAPPADAHRQVPGGAKFTWPPAKTGGPIPVGGGSAPLESNSTPSVPTYRPPPGTQRVVPPPPVAGVPKFGAQTPTSFQPAAAPPYFPPPAAPMSYSPVMSPASSRPSSFVSSSAGSPIPPLSASAKVPPPTAPKPSSAVRAGPQVAARPKPGGGGPWAANGMASGGSAPFATGTSGLSQGVGSRPAPKRGRGMLSQQVAIGGKIPICSNCGSPIRGPFVTAMGKNWCPDHFLCANASCRRSLQDIGFVEEQSKLYCEHCYESYMAPVCRKCGHRIKGDCLNALEQTWHPECFVCSYCKTAFGNSSFYLEDGMPYCEKDWNELFTTKCVGCGFPIEAGDRWVEALNNNYHSQCFKCTICHKNLEGQSFFAKGGRPFCKAHAR